MSIVSVASPINMTVLKPERMYDWDTSEEVWANIDACIVDQFNMNAEKALEIEGCCELFYVHSSGMVIAVDVDEFGMYYILIDEAEVVFLLKEAIPF